MCLLIYQQIDFYESIKALDFTFIYLEQVVPRAFFIASIMNALAVIFSILTAILKIAIIFLWTRPCITIILLYIFLHPVFRKNRIFHYQNCNYPHHSFTFLFHREFASLMWNGRQRSSWFRSCLTPHITGSSQWDFQIL